MFNGLHTKVNYFPNENAAGTVSSANTHFDIQVAYIHTFKKSKEGTPSNVTKMDR